MGFWEDNVNEANVKAGCMYYGNGYMQREVNGLKVDTYFSTIAGDFWKVRIHNKYNFVPYFNAQNIYDLGWRFFATNFGDKVYINVPKVNQIKSNLFDYEAANGVMNAYLNLNTLTETTVFDNAIEGTMNFVNNIVINTTSSIKNLDNFVKYINNYVDPEFNEGYYKGQFVKGINNVQMSVFNAKYFKTTMPEEIVNSPYYEPNIDKPQVK